MIASEYGEALARAAEAALTVVLGDTDTGKTTFVTALANTCTARGLSMGLVDTDLGQSEIGPPTTIGLGRVRGVLGRAADAELAALHFVGATSPPGHLLSIVVGTRRLVERARAEGLDRVVVDTSGLVAGELGRVLKQAKIDLLDPDLLVCLERGRECGHIVRPYLQAGRPAVLRLPVVPAARRRTWEERRRHRESRLRAYFAPARPVTLDLGRVVLRSPALFEGTAFAPRQLAAAASAVGQTLLWGERREWDVAVVTRHALDDDDVRRLGRLLDAGTLVPYALEDLEGALAGLDNPTRETLGLGVVRGLDFGKPSLTVETSVPAEAIAAVTIGREKFPAG